MNDKSEVVESESVSNLIAILEEDYMNRYGAPNMSAAIRDMLTDLIHVCNAQNPPVDIVERTDDAYGVYLQEI